MSIITVGSGFASSWTASQTISPDVVASEGDIILCIMNLHNAPNITSAGGAFPFDIDLNTTYAANGLLVMSRIAGDSEPTSYTFDFDGEGVLTGLIRIFRGVDTANKFDVAPIVANMAQGNNATPTASSITTSNDNSKAVFVAGFDASSVVTMDGYTNGFANEIETASGRNITTVTKDIATPGEVGAALCGGDVVSNWFALQFALNASSAGPNVASIDGPIESGATATLTGVDFGTEQGSVTQNNISLSVVSWGDTNITVETIDIGASLLRFGQHTFEVTDSSGNTGAINAEIIPIQGYEYVEVENPSAEEGSFFYNYTGGAPTTGQQLVYESVAGLVINTNGEWQWESLPVSSVTVDAYVIDLDGTKGAVGTATFDLNEVAGGEGAMNDSVQAIIDSAASVSDMRRRLREYFRVNDLSDYQFTAVEMSSLLHVLMKYD